MARNLFGASKASPAGGRSGKKRKRRKPAATPKPAAKRPAQKPPQEAAAEIQEQTPSPVIPQGVGTLQGPPPPLLLAVDTAALQRSGRRLDDVDLPALRFEAAREMEANPYAHASWIDPWCSDPLGGFTLYSRFDRTWRPNAYFRPTTDQRNALRRKKIRSLTRRITQTQWDWVRRYRSPAFTFWQYHVRYARQNFFDDSLFGEAFEAMRQQLFGYICEEWFEFPWDINPGESVFDEQKVPKPFKRFMEAMELDGRHWRYAVLDDRAKQSMRLDVRPNPNPYDHRTVLEDHMPQIVDRSKPIDATNITWVAPPEPPQADPHHILRKQKRKIDRLTRAQHDYNLHTLLSTYGPLALRLLHWLSQQPPLGANTHKQRRFVGHQGFKGRLGDLAAQANVTMALLGYVAGEANIAWARDTDFKNKSLDCNADWGSQVRFLPYDRLQMPEAEQQQIEVDFALCWHHSRWADVIDPELLAWSAQQPTDAAEPELWLSLFLFLSGMSLEEWETTHLDDKAAIWIEHTRPIPMEGDDPILDAELDAFDPRFQGMDQYRHDLHPDFWWQDLKAADGLRAFLAKHPYSQELADRIRLVQDVADAMNQFDAAMEGERDSEAAGAIRDHVEAALPYLSRDAEGLLRTARFVRFVTHPEEA